MERIIGLLFSGFMTRLYAAGVAIWIATEVASYFVKVMGAIHHAF